MNRKNHNTPATSPVISTGLFKGMKLATPPGQGTRPTSAKTRAAAMNALQARLPGATFCDAFAGSGAIGIEALSRGAARCTFVESAAAALGALKRNLTECERRSLAQGGTPPEVQVIANDAVQFFSRHSQSGTISDRNRWEFDIIWADPPYALVERVLPDLLAFADASLVLGGILMLESGASAGYRGSTGQLNLKSEKKYGATYITTWEKKA